MKKLTSLILAMITMFACAVPAFAEDTAQIQETAPSQKQDYDTAYYEQFKGKELELNVYNWGEYISNGEDNSMDVNKEFEALTGIKVNYTTFDTNESMYAKLKSGANSYDVVIPSDYMVSRLVKENMLEPLDFKNIPNFKNIDEKFLNPSYDPENKFSVPYTFGTVGIIYNKDMVKGEITSWDSLWDTQYAGKILMFKNPRDAFAIALFKLGYNVNTEDEKQLQEAADLLKQQKSLVQAYVMDQIFDKMQGGEAALAPYYAGDFYTMKEVNDKLEFCVPKEGTNLFVDAVCIPKGAANKQAAEMYINFLNEPQVAAANIEYICYSTPNKAALALLDEETRNDPVRYPNTEQMKNMQAFTYLPDKTNLLLDQLWTEILSDDANYFNWAMPLFLVAAVVLAVVTFFMRKKKKR
ncbi:MAG: spermidine/putrescine ABC transporter substrate-binding protein [Oscillospiraceae bacterium]